MVFMIIDSHTHVGFSDNINSDIKKLRASMKRARIAKSIVFAGELNGCSTEQLLVALEPFRDVLFPVGSVSPLSGDKPSLKQVEAWLSGKQILGLKFYPGYEPFYPFDRELRPYLALLEKYKKPAIFHSGDTYRGKTAKLKYAHPLHIDEVAVDFPDLPIVIAHLGYPWVIDVAEMVYKNKNVYADCSGLAYGVLDAGDKRTIKQLLQQFFDYEGIEGKLLFGTDWPIAEQPEYAAYVQSLFPKKYRKGIMHDNAASLFGI